MKEIKIRVSNPSKKKLQLVLEPLGEIHYVAPGGSIILRAHGGEPADNNNECLELESADDALTIYGWRSALVEVDRDSN